MIPFRPMEPAGLIPGFLSVYDDRDAVSQINDNYQHGGGWTDFVGFKLRHLSTGQCVLDYPDDPPFRQVSEAYLRGERIVIFESAFVAVIQQDGSYRVARID